MRRLYVLIASAVPIVLVSASCRDNTADQESTSPPIVVQPSSDRVEVPAATVELIALNAIRHDQMVDPVVFAVDGAPAGVWVQPSASETADGVTSTILAIAADSGVPPGTYPVRLAGRGSNGASDAKTLAVVVLPQGESGYTFQVRPLSILAGGSGSVTVSLIRANLTEIPVAMTVGPLPAGFSVTLSTSVTTKATAGMTVSVAANVPPGFYTITLRGTVMTPAYRLADRITSIPVVVRSAN